MNVINFFLNLLLPATIWAQNDLNYTTFGNYTYILGRNASTYHTARNGCNALEAELIVIQNQAIFDHISKFLKENSRKYLINESSIVANDNSSRGVEFVVGMKLRCWAYENALHIAFLRVWSMVDTSIVT